MNAPAVLALPRPAAWRLGSLLHSLLRSYLLGRLLKAALTVFVVTSFTFFLVRLMPGNPVDIYVMQIVTQFGMTYAEAQAQVAAIMGIDLKAPLHLQYLGYLQGLAHGNLGTSILSKGTPVTAIILRFLPWTLFSVGLALLISFTLGIGLGMISAYRREGWFDHLVSALASLFSAIPDYLLAILLVVFLGVQLKLLPIAAMRGSISPGVQVGFTWGFIGDVLFHAALPVATYVLAHMGTWMLTMKSSTLAALEEDYVAVARAKGLPDRRITTAYVGRNAVLPLFTQFAISAGFIVGGSILIEFIFVYQGIGLLLLTSVNQRDHPVMQGVFMLITCAVVFANLFADLFYSKLDPRIGRTGGAGE